MSQNKIVVATIFDLCVSVTAALVLETVLLLISGSGNNCWNFHLISFMVKSRETVVLQKLRPFTQPCPRWLF